MCLPKDVDKMSLCDGKGCLRQMESNGGGVVEAYRASTLERRSARVACQEIGKKLI